MTFVLNVLHKDFSVLVADKQGGASGTVVLETGGTTITVNSPNITINGIQKLFTNHPNSLVVGIAGQIQDHPYTTRINDAKDTTSALDIIHSHMATSHVRGNRRAIIDNTPVMQNEGLVTYFDVDTGEFFTDLFILTPSFIGSQRYQASGGGARLVHIGSGSPVLESAVGLESINAFFSSLREIQDPSACVEWITHAYKLVSEKAVGCGSEFVAKCATRNDPVFRDLVSG